MLLQAAILVIVHLISPKSILFAQSASMIPIEWTTY
jgi:hypothetical protein